ncbi:hypothetical protein AMTRI_Chr01g103800 [Amborella trichopoda]
MYAPRRTKFRKQQKGRTKATESKNSKIHLAIWICVYPDLSVTKKPLEVRMGNGKGSFEYWACNFKNGQILYEINGVSCTLARQAARIANKKLPMRTTFVKKD